MPRFVNVDLYNRYKDEILKLTNARQRFEPKASLRGLTDREIASRLGLDAADVTEIRCIAEIEMISLKKYLDADNIKEQRFKRAPCKV